MAGETDLEPAFAGECSGGFEGAGDDGGECAADLWWGQAFREHVAAGGVGEEMEGSAAIGDGASDGWVGTVGCDHVLLYGGVALGSVVDGGVHGGPEGGFVADRVHELEKVGLDNEAVVEVPVEVGAIAVGTVAEVPALVFAEGVVNDGTVPRSLHGHEQDFVHGGEEKPVVERRLYLSFGDERFCEAMLGGSVEFFQELFWGAEQGEREEG